MKPLRALPGTDPDWLGLSRLTLTGLALRSPDWLGSRMAEGAGPEYDPDSVCQLQQVQPGLAPRRARAKLQRPGRG
jgi:hypothetical protein